MDAIVTKVKPLADYTLFIELSDNSKGTFDMKPYLNFGSYKSLKDYEYFKRVRVQYGDITWPDEQDIAPERILAELVHIVKPAE